jgi:hypothetical protein
MQKNMAMGPAGPRTKNDSAGEGQQQSTQKLKSVSQSVMSRGILLVVCCEHETRGINDSICSAREVGDWFFPELLFYFLNQVTLLYRVFLL